MISKKDAFKGDRQHFLELNYHNQQHQFCIPASFYIQRFGINFFWQTAFCHGFWQDVFNS